MNLESAERQIITEVEQLVEANGRVLTWHSLRRELEITSIETLPDAVRDGPGCHFRREKRVKRRVG